MATGIRIRISATRIQATAACVEPRTPMSSSNCLFEPDGACGCGPRAATITAARLIAATSSAITPAISARRRSTPRSTTGPASATARAEARGVDTCATGDPATAVDGNDDGAPEAAASRRFRLRFARDDCATYPTVAVTPSSWLLLTRLATAPPTRERDAPGARRT